MLLPLCCFPDTSGCISQRLYNKCNVIACISDGIRMRFLWSDRKHFGLCLRGFRSVHSCLHEGSVRISFGLPDRSGRKEAANSRKASESKHCSNKVDIVYTFNVKSFWGSSNCRGLQNIVWVVWVCFVILTPSHFLLWRQLKWVKWVSEGGGVNNFFTSWRNANCLAALLGRDIWICSGVPSWVLFLFFAGISIFVPRR